MGRLSAVLRDPSRARAAFIPYITAGDPSLAATLRFLDALAAAGADVIELGVPFSDPVADGPVNQRAAERALKGGATLARILDMAGRWRRAGGRTPLVLFSYFNPLLRMGLDLFARRCRAARIAGVLPVDLPPEEAGEFRRALARAGIETVFLASPTTAPGRLALIDRASTGFVYYVSRLGVTGVRRSLPAGLAAEVAALRRKIAGPVAVGFGISTAAQAAAVGRLADGVVVGSALVRIIAESPGPRAAGRLRRAAASMVRALAAARRFGNIHGGLC